MRLKVLLILCALALVAAKPDTIAKKGGPPMVKAPVKHAPAVLQSDSTAPKLRSFDQQAVSKYNEDKDFQYIEKKKPKPSLWERFWRWFFSPSATQRQPHKPGSVPNISPVVQLLMLMIGVGILLFIIIKILGADIAGLFKRTPKKPELPYIELLEDINEIVFDDELEKAAANRNYKLAVRLLYLRALKQLNDANLIHWQKDKTNAVYIDEIRNTTQRRAFSVLTLQFEYIWYGDFPVDGQSYQNISTLFHDFKQLLPS